MNHKITGGKAAELTLLDHTGSIWSLWNCFALWNSDSLKFIKDSLKILKRFKWYRWFHMIPYDSHDSHDSQDTRCPLCNEELGEAHHDANLPASRIPIIPVRFFWRMTERLPWIPMTAEGWVVNVVNQWSRLVPWKISMDLLWFYHDFIALDDWTRLNWIGTKCYIELDSNTQTYIYRHNY